jgi:hypothetical protein
MLGDVPRLAEGKLPERLVGNAIRRIKLPAAFFFI